MLDLQVKTIGKLEKFAVFYHDIFDYPLSFSELFKWTPKKLPANGKTSYEVIIQNKYCFLKGREGLLYKRSVRQRFSRQKMKIAENASKLLSKISTIEMIAVSGSLAMQNADKESDIDLLIITKANKLWTTRLLTYLLLKLSKNSIRKPKDSNQKDRLCLNIWMDKANLAWSKKDRNIYTAHEMAQLVPLVNKDKTFEYFLFKNSWVSDFWPNAVRIKKEKPEDKISKSKIGPLEKIAYKIQLSYMKPKITNEKVSLTRAIFHPKDIGKVVIEKLYM